MSGSKSREGKSASMIFVPMRAEQDSSPRKDVSAQSDGTAWRGNR
jgi:hypothetical protein